MRCEARNLYFSYGARPVLSGVDLTLEPGGLTLLLGPNGSGKSTLLRLLTGELTPARGEILLDGREVRRYSGRERARRLGVVLQSAPPALDFTVREYVLMGRNARMPVFSAPSAHDMAVAGNAMELFHVSSLAERPCNALSGGERQRAMLAAAYAAEPEIFLLDEPTSATDPAQTFAVLEILRARARTRTMLMITHDLMLGANCADRILLLKDGKIFADGPPEDVLTRENLLAVYGLAFAIGAAPNGAMTILPEKNLRRGKDD